MRITKFFYIFLLLYILAALIFWGFSLQRLNSKLYSHEVNSLIEHIDSVQQPQLYKTAFNKITKDANNRNSQYLGEGVSFILVIIIGAIVVYSSMKSNMQLSKRQSNFMLSITHELKSPIAAVKLNLETIRRRKLDESTQNMLIDKCINETNRLNDLCNNLLLASQMESKHFAPSFEIINLKPILDDSTQLIIQRSKHDIQNLTQDVYINGDPFLISMIINNLLENAVKYTLPGTEIIISSKLEDDQVIITIADQGGGIPDDEKTKIFKKFYRIGNENARTSKGTGLGLFLVSQIVKINNGNISVRDNIPFGTIFEIVFPAAQPSNTLIDS